MKTVRFSVQVMTLVVVVAAMGSVKAVDMGEVLDRVGVEGGLVVFVGCDNVESAVNLSDDPSFIAHMVDDNISKVRAANKYLQSTGVLGQVSAGLFDGKTLPYVDGLVNCVVVPESSRVGTKTVARVLAPGGVVLAKEEFESEELVRSSSMVVGWNVSTKRLPPELDDWTHYLHDADGHAMSNDTVVAQPYHIQWIGSPRHSKSHKHLTSINVMVSSGGRLFAIADVSPNALPNSLPSRWAVVARDAYNGIELWRRPLSSWQPYYVEDRNSYPADLHRRLVADDGLVFVTMSIHGPVSALDAATGEIVTTYADTEKTEDIIYDDGILYLSINMADASKINRLKMAYRHVEPKRKRLMAIEAKTGRVLWNKPDFDGLMPMTLAVKNNYLYYQDEQDVVCLDKRSGNVLWRSARPSEYFRPGWSSPTLVAFDDIVISADRQSGPNQKIGKDHHAAGGFSTGDIVAFSAETGERLWDGLCAEGCREPTDVFRRANELWYGKTLQRDVQEYREAHDPKTGHVLRQAPADENFPDQHHHRCYRDKATVNFILGSRTGVEFTDLDTGEVSIHNWIRGNCKFGILPANGLLYLPPEQCGCYVESKLTGFHALAPKRSTQVLEKDQFMKDIGPGMWKSDTSGTEPTFARSGPGPEDWPTFRHDNTRHGQASTTVPTDLSRAWQTRLGGRLTQPVVAAGKLFVSSIDEHTLYVLDAATGEVMQKHLVGGRIDSPPTIVKGYAVFGCRDGWVYAIDYTSGQMAWRCRVAPANRNLVDNDRIESVWPVHGSVLVDGDKVYYAAGRSSYVDGGIRMGTLDLITGEPVMNKTFYSRDAEGNAVNLYEPFPEGPKQDMEMPGVLPDVMSSDGEKIWMRMVHFNKDLEIQKGYPNHLFSSMGFLDDSWWEIAYWIYGRHMFGGRAGIAHATRLYPTANIMVCDDTTTYGYQEGYEGIKEAAFVAADKVPARRGEGKKAYIETDWTADVPLHVFGLVLAGDTLFMAGPPKVDTDATQALLETLTTDKYDPPTLLKEAVDTFAGKQGGLLYAMSKTDGRQLANITLDTVPTFDGVVAANKKLYMTTKDGSVICMK